MMSARSPAPVAAGVSRAADKAAEVELKLGRVRGWLDASDLDGLLLGSQANFAWITAGGRSHVSIGEEAGIASVLVTSDRAHVLTANIEVRAGGCRTWVPPAAHGPSYLRGAPAGSC